MSFEEWKLLKSSKMMRKSSSLFSCYETIRLGSSGKTATKWIRIAFDENVDFDCEWFLSQFKKKPTRFLQFVQLRLID